MSYWQEYFKDLLTADRGAMKGSNEIDEASKGLGTDSIDNSVDYSFIEREEGFRDVGYVPTKGGKAIGNSGVTIGGGLDLGDKDESSLKDLGLTDDEINLLLPYTGVKGEDAISLLKEKPLKVDEDQMRDIMKRVYSSIEGTFSKEYNKHSALSFENLPSGIKTSMVSSAINFGIPNLKKWKYWKQVTSGDFESAINNLNTWEGNKELKPRRKREARLMKMGLKDFNKG